MNSFRVTLQTIRRELASIAFTVAFIMLVIRPCLQIAPSKDEPVFSVILRRNPVQLDVLLDSYKHPVLLPSLT
jgi:hypothetical protein